MVTYTFTHEHFSDAIQVGEPVWIDDEQIVVIHILEVDFAKGEVTFMGFKVKELSV